MMEPEMFKDLTEGEIRALEEKILRAFLGTKLDSPMAKEMAEVHILIMDEIAARSFGR